MLLLPVIGQECWREYGLRGTRAPTWTAVPSNGVWLALHQHRACGCVRGCVRGCVCGCVWLRVWVRVWFDRMVCLFAEG